jgi:adenylate kinase family enzyme
VELEQRTTVVVIAGAPGAGKSTVARALQAVLGCPLFEFGWIPEFRNTGDREMPYVEEEGLAFENLVLVTKNYAAHGFRWVILTDLQPLFVAQVGAAFDGYDHRIFTLRQEDESLVKARVLNESRSSDHRDVDGAIERNRALHERPPHPSERFINVGRRSVDEVVESVLADLQIAVLGHHD